MNTKSHQHKTGRRLAFLMLTLCLLIGSASGCASKEPKKEADPSDNVQKTPKDTKDKQEPDKQEVQEPKKEDTGKRVYMTFDDGPHKNTGQLLDVLDQYDVKATFFVTAQFLDEENLIRQIKEIDKRGHEVAVHSYSHEYDEIYSSVDAYLADYKKMDDIIYKATGKRSKLFRFPGGSNTGYNAAIRSELIAKMESLGLQYYDWNAYDGDCDGYQGQALVDKAVQESSYEEKSILLMHDMLDKPTVITSLPALIEQLQAKGYRFLPLDPSVEPIQFA